MRALNKGFSILFLLLLLQPAAALAGTKEAEKRGPAKSEIKTNAKAAPAPTSAGGPAGLISVRDFGAKGNGIADDTGALQRALDASAPNGGRLYLPKGTYNTGSLYFPAKVIMEGDGDATTLKFIGASGFMLSPRMTNTANLFVHIRDLSLDMQGKASVGIRMTNCWHGSVARVNISNLPAGTYKVDNNDYPCAGIAIIGSEKISGAYYNTLEQCFVQGQKTRYANSGFHLSSTTETSTQRANFNRLIQCRALWCQVGINLANGNDCYVEMGEVSNCTIGVRVRSKRNVLFKTYGERCDIAILLEKESNVNTVLLSGGRTGTRVFVEDKGNKNVVLYRPLELLKNIKPPFPGPAGTAETPKK